MTALLIEEYPLLQLGLRQMLESIHGAGNVITLAPTGIPLVSGRHRHAELLVFGMPSDSVTGWQQLDDAHKLLAPQRVLLLADTLPLQRQRLPTAYSARCHICGSLPKSASLAVIESAIRLASSAVQDIQVAVDAPVAPAAARSTLLPMHEVGIQTLAACAVAPCPVEAQASAGLPAAAATEEGQVNNEAWMLKITPRQYDVLVLLARGYPIKTISRMLDVSEATVKTHACTLYRRLKVRNKSEAVYAALQRGATLEWVNRRPEVSA